MARHLTAGSIRGRSPQSVNYGGSSAAVKAVPAPGCHFANWAGDKGPFGTEAPHCF